MIYKENVKIGLKDVWRENEVSNKAILEYLEDVAAYHSDSVGYGVNTTSQTNLTWVLLDWKVKVLKRPKYGQLLEVHTWSRAIEKVWAYRDFKIYDNNNELCVIASSKWLLVNAATGKIAKINQEMADKYQTEVGNSVFDEYEIEKLKVPDSFISCITYQVRRKDIDVIGHMHNLYYLDLAYETLPDDVYETRPFNNFRIMYKKEIKLGDTVICKYSCENSKHIVVIESEDEKQLHAVIELY